MTAKKFIEILNRVVKNWNQKKFRKTLDKICTEKGFETTTTTFLNFNDLGEKWRHPDWTNLFRILLDYIKKGKDYHDDKDNTNGNCVLRPLTDNKDNKFLAVYFNLEKNEIYMIKFEDPDDVQDNHLHSLKH